MTTAAIARSSSPTPMVDWPDDERAATGSPARPASRPLATYIATLIRATGRPISRAEVHVAPA
jgi:hypothetical protein